MRASVDEKAEMRAGERSKAQRQKELRPKMHEWQQQEKSSEG